MESSANKKMVILSIPEIQGIVAEYFKDKPIKSVYLFGSYARGEAKSKSDIDLLISLFENSKITYFTLGGYLYDLQNLFLKKVDLVHEKAIKPFLEKNIEDEKLLLVSK